MQQITTWRAVARATPASVGRAAQNRSLHAARPPAPVAGRPCIGSGLRRAPLPAPPRASPLDKLREALAGRGAEQKAADEEEEGLGDMLPLDQDGTPAGTEEPFGPTAVLLAGFLRPEYDTFKALLADMGADMVALVPAGRAAMAGTLQAALEGGTVEYEQPPLGQRRAVILSGMYTSEVLEVIAAYKDAGLPPTVFAAAVPNNYTREVADVVDSCWKDQMVAQQRASMGKLEASVEEP
ncbi:hypothetical protein Rsub_01437 [Raphidocelis subcapitata]|uniref:Uncharacterized protein n=1 Tax=Raphidocelis subcapitata TaxID=307507 RepID=A0A2V0NN13_9CHLO|nr:hypothetical protein Rsub_01437 [Raphidocelis subcapitata]|eukprot:GBF88938.1 hypothetical protein Rsub_01437 [Raphidocelis subcapitata]